MSKIHYVGPRVEISHHGIVYKRSKEDKYIYLMAALEILKNIDNNYEKQRSYSHHFENKKLEEAHLHTLLEYHEDDLEECISDECKKYKQKILDKIEYIKTLPHLSNVDKEVWIKNIELMTEYKIQRAINKMYYMHCIKDIVQVIKHKKIKEITAPFNKNFFHIFNTIKGTLITGIPSLNTKVTNENDKENNMVIKLYID